MTEMQWSCKTTAFHIHIALPYSLCQAERVVLMECLPGLDLTVFMFAAIFYFVLLLHDICSQCVSPEPRVPLVSIVLANIRGQSS